MTGAPVIRSWSPQNPADLVAEAPALLPARVASLAEAARGAQRAWWAMPAVSRSDALTAAAAELLSRREEAVSLMVREVGKPLAEARGEADRSIAILRYYAQACLAASGSHYPPSVGGWLFTDRRPHGVAGLITPWNFPLAIPLWKAAPALAVGNAALLKPSPEAIGCAAFLEEILGHHLPGSLVTVTPGGPETGSAVIANSDVVSFTGSTGVGRAVALAAAERGIPAQCEMGGQNPAIVLPDADIAATASLIAGAAMGFAGQKCTATRRVIVVGEQEEFVDSLVAAVQALPVGDPATPGTVVGPLISERARELTRAAVRRAQAEGRVLLPGGSLAATGWFERPVIADHLPDLHPLSQQETFGPFITVHRVPDVAAALRLANNVRYGLVTSIHGRDIDRILGLVPQVEAGMIRINAPTTGVDFYAPFGGEKESSYGPREQGTAALDFYSSTRTITIASPGR